MNEIASTPLAPDSLEATMSIEIGNIVWGQWFPTHDGKAAPHPGLVTRIEDDVGFGPRIFVALGSTKKVSKTGHMPSEFVVFPDDPGFAATGLKSATRFDFREGSFLIRPEMQVSIIGKVASRTLLCRLMDAYQAWIRETRRSP